eukprot:TRINITY_DN706_c0_g1_i1.p1 TRINITY_DN706_c0_g1~~TRINITY_DN706_c0_g1_i1.p1  ORF type:complete len:182 (-),score=30.31 TRINITY_DN706_c0_g1_i1:479-991(-)
MSSATTTTSAEALAKSKEEKKKEKDEAGFAEKKNLQGQMESLISGSRWGQIISLAVSLMSETKTTMGKHYLYEVTRQAMENMKVDESAKFITDASEDISDHCMKSVYKGFAVKGANFNQLLTWHSKLTEKAGLGCIMRTLCIQPKVAKPAPSTAAPLDKEKDTKAMATKS